MSYGELGQKKPGTHVITRESDDRQPGSRSNQTATNASKAGSKVATSDHNHVSSRQVSAPSPTRPEPDPLTRRGYPSAKTAAGSGPIRKVGKKITRKRM